MSKTSSCEACGETSGAQEITASRASSSGRITSSRSPVCRAAMREEVVAVPRPPAGLGRHQPDVGHPMPLELVGADLERGEGAADGAARQVPGALEPRAEADRLGEGVDDAEAAGFRRRDQHAATVRAQVEGSVQGRVKLRRLGAATWQLERYNFLRGLGEVLRHA